MYYSQPISGARSTRVKFEGDLAIAKNRFLMYLEKTLNLFQHLKNPLPLNLLQVLRKKQ